MSSLKMESGSDLQSYWDDESEGYLSDDDEREDETASQQSEDTDFFDEPESNYTIISEEEICQRQGDAVSTITNFLSVSETEAGILLRSLKWSVSTINDTWFADEELVRRSVGLPTPPPESRTLASRDLVAATDPARRAKCPICLDMHAVSTMTAAPICGHFFCDTCWTGVHTQRDSRRAGVSHSAMRGPVLRGGSRRRHDSVVCRRRRPGQVPALPAQIVRREQQEGQVVPCSRM